jgi:hypothetical protein
VVRLLLHALNELIIAYARSVEVGEKVRELARHRRARRRSAMEMGDAAKLRVALLRKSSVTLLSVGKGVSRVSAAVARVLRVPAHRILRILRRMDKLSSRFGLVGRDVSGRTHMHLIPRAPPTLRERFRLLSNSEDPDELPMGRMRVLEDEMELVHTALISSIGLLYRRAATAQQYELPCDLFDFVFRLLLAICVQARLRDNARLLGVDDCKQKLAAIDMVQGKVVAFADLPVSLLDTIREIARTMPDKLEEVLDLLRKRGEEIGSPTVRESGGTGQHRGLLVFRKLLQLPLLDREPFVDDGSFKIEDVCLASLTLAGIRPQLVRSLLAQYVRHRANIRVAHVAERALTARRGAGAHVEQFNIVLGGNAGRFYQDSQMNVLRDLKIFARVLGKEIKRLVALGGMFKYWPATADIRRLMTAIDSANNRLSMPERQMQDTRKLLAPITADALEHQQQQQAPKRASTRSAAVAAAAAASHAPLSERLDAAFGAPLSAAFLRAQGLDDYSVDEQQQRNARGGIGGAAVASSAGVDSGKRQQRPRDALLQGAAGAGAGSASESSSFDSASRSDSAFEPDEDEYENEDVEGAAAAAGDDDDGGDDDDDRDSDGAAAESAGAADVHCCHHHRRRGSCCLCFVFCSHSRNVRVCVSSRARSRCVLRRQEQAADQQHSQRNNTSPNCCWRCCR